MFVFVGQSVRVCVCRLQCTCMCEDQSVHVCVRRLDCACVCAYVRVCMCVCV